MRNRNFGVHTRKPGDCNGAPQLTLLYTGATNAVPVVEFGNIVFKGATSNFAAKAHGIGIDGAATDNNFHKIDFLSILNGESGVKINSCGSSTKHTYTMECKEVNCEEIEDILALDIREISECDNTLWDTWNSPKEVFTVPDCNDNCPQKINKLIGLINGDVNSPAVASLVGTKGIKIEAKKAGVKLVILDHRGLTEPDQTVPPSSPRYYSDDISDWFAGVTVSDTNKCMNVVEIYNYEKRPIRESVATTDVSSDPSSFQTVIQLTTHVFDPDNANSTAAFTALMNILKNASTPAALFAKYAGNNTSDEFLTYQYCVKKTDAGTNAALTAATTAYVTGDVYAISRSKYQSGASYYTLYSKSATPPTAASGDTVSAGPCGEDDYVD